MAALCQAPPGATAPRTACPPWPCWASHTWGTPRIWLAPVTAKPPFQGQSRVLGTNVLFSWASWTSPAGGATWHPALVSGHHSYGLQHLPSLHPLRSFLGCHLKGRAGGRDLCPLIHSSNGPNQPGLGQAGARSLELRPGLPGWQGPQYWVICCFPGFAGDVEAAAPQCWPLSSPSLIKALNVQGRGFGSPTALPLQGAVRGVAQEAARASPTEEWRFWLFLALSEPACDSLRPRSG